MGLSLSLNQPTPADSPFGQPVQNLRIDPRNSDVDGLYRYARGALGAGRPHDGIAAIRRAVELRRGYPPYYHLWALTAQAQGQTKHAEQALEACLRLAPFYPPALATLGRLKATDGRRRAGLGLLARAGAIEWGNRADRWGAAIAGWRATRAEHTASARHLARGMAFERRRQFEAALKEYAGALVGDDGCIRALEASARVLLRFERYTEALDRLRHAAKLAPDDLPVQARLGELSALLRQPEEAGRCVRKAISLAPGSIEALRAQAWLHYHLGSPDTAAEAFHACLQQRPNDPELLVGLGRALEYAGRLAEARETYARAAAVAPGDAPALWRLATARDKPQAGNDTAPGRDTGARDTRLRRQVERGLKRRKLLPRERMLLHYAAAALADARNDLDSAFAHYRLANDLADVIYNPDAQAGFTDALITAFDTDLYRARESWGSRSSLPVFIVGMPRSGTSLIEQMLASHPQVAGAGELQEMHQIVSHLAQPAAGSPPFPQSAPLLDGPALSALAERYLARIAQSDPAILRVTDKMPTNFLYLGLIALLFPNARIVHCTRHPMDTCLSIYQQAFVGQHIYKHDLVNLGRFYAEYRRLMAHWNRVLPLRILEARYEKVVADPEAAARDLVAFCELEWDAACLDFSGSARAVRTASARQVRQPVHSASVGRWQRYERHLAPLKHTLVTYGVL